ncbi:MAG: hypothetical protein MPK30_06780 [Gammaproteobacteria bacterium]|nr:hypothetical protein [Gammaproteobacteria bacterium]
MNAKIKIAIAAAAALAVIVVIALLIPRGGPGGGDVASRGIEAHAGHVYDEMVKCIGKQGSACLLPFLRDGNWVFDAGGRLDPACLAATYRPGEPHASMVKEAPAGCYIGQNGLDFCVAAKGESDDTHCIDSRGRDKRNAYCLVTGVCTD